jgi:hypothetical protein
VVENQNKEMVLVANTHQSRPPQRAVLQVERPSKDIADELPYRLTLPGILSESLYRL